MMEKEKELIDFATDKIKKQKKDTINYNIFEVLGVTHKEVIICRFLADLLNPHGHHGENERLLKSFMVQILFKDDHYYKWTDEIYHVETEYIYDETQRRIDIVIWSRKKFIPIEVKIYAEDQEAQCYDYWNYAKKRNGGEETYIWYLTIDGRIPSYYSLQGLPLKYVRTISFKEIIGWLSKELETTKKTRAKIAIEQFIETLKIYTGGINMDVVNKLYESPEMYKAGLEISHALDEVRIKLVNAVLHDIEDMINKELDLTKSTFNFMEYENCAKDYGKKSFTENSGVNWPGINYEMPITFDEAEIKTVKLILRIEIFRTLWAGIVAIDFNGTVATILEDKEKIKALWAEIESRFDTRNCKREKDRNNWNVFLLDEEENGELSGRKGNEIPDFQHMNDSAILLIDENSRKEYVEEVMVGIKKIYTKEEKCKILKKG